MKKTLQREDVRDYEGEQTYERQMEEAEDVLKTHDSKTYNVLVDLKRYTGMNAHDEYVETMNNKLRDIRSREGTLYTPETKAALIREEAEKTAVEYIEKAETEAQYQTEKYYVLGVNLTEAIAKEQLSNDQLASMEPMIAKAKTDLSFASKPEQVTKAYSELVERGEHDRATAKFAAMYAYLFMDRLKEMPEGQGQRGRMTENSYMQELLQKAKDYSYSEVVQAKIFIKEHFEERNAFRLKVTSPSPFLINMHRDNIIQKNQ